MKEIMQVINTIKKDIENHINALEGTVSPVVKT